MICYIVPWWPSCLSDQITFSHSESDVCRVSRLPPWSSCRILELNGSATLNLHFTLMLPIKFQLNLTYYLGDDLKKMLFEEFQDGLHGGHLGHWNGTILAILNLCVTMMLLIKFWLNPTYGLGGDAV